MAHISSIGATRFATMSYSNNAISYTSTAIATFRNDKTIAAANTLLGSQNNMVSGGEAATFQGLSDIREFPQVGPTPNIVSVPVYGQTQSSQIIGQGDAPEQVYVLNYVPSEHADIQDYQGDNILRLFRVRLTDSDETITDATQYDDYYVLGKVASVQVTPNLTDSMQASLTLTTEGDFVGPLTTTA